MRQMISKAVLGKLVAATIALLSYSAPSACHAQQAAPSATTGSPVVESKETTSELDNKRYQLEVRKVDIEEKKLSDARSAVKLTAISILIPVVLGFATLYWQARTAYKLKAIEWELKAAEVVLNSKSTRAGEERAAALRKLFPHRISEQFVEVFRKGTFKLPGTAYQEKKLELFKAMSANPDKSKDIFQLYAMIYADEEIVLTEFVDKWRNAYPDDAAWVDDFSSRWKQAYPEGRWKKQPPQAANPAAPADQKASLPGR